MDTFFIVYKHIGDGLLSIVGIVTSLIFISKTFSKWYNGMEKSLRNSILWARVVGSILCLFCVVYIGVTIREGVEESHDRSPEYQAKIAAQVRQIELKDHVNNFAANLESVSVDTAFMEWDAWQSQANGWVTKLNDEGIWSTNLVRIYGELRFRSMNDPNNAATLKAIAVELRHMAEKLPKND